MLLTFGLTIVDQPWDGFGRCLRNNDNGGSSSEERHSNSAYGLANIRNAAKHEIDYPR
jgi:hypothetical protein